MKVNFNQNFKNWEGEDLLVDGKPQPMGKIIAQTLFNGEGIKKSDDPLKDGERKLMAYSVCMRIAGTTDPVEITVEEGALIKEAMSYLTPGCYAQVVNLIEGK